jgi:hypothetical protein
MTEQKIAVVDGRKFEAVRSFSGCNGCSGMSDYELCQRLPSCDGGLVFVEAKEEAPAVAATEVHPKLKLVVLHGIISVSTEANDLLEQGYKILSMSADLTSVAFVLGEGVVHPQFSVKG